MEILGLVFLFVLAGALCFRLACPMLGRIADINIRHFSLSSLLLAITVAAIAIATLAAVVR